VRFDLLSKINKFGPLLGVFGFVTASTLILSILFESSVMQTGKLFMAMFFLTFGAFKVYNLEGFKKAFEMYDPLAAKNSFYASVYPFVEIALGTLYLTIFVYSLPRLELIVYSSTVLIVGINALGVLKALTDGRKIQCACLGDVFNVPMTWVTLLEDLLMASMALIMLLTLFY